MPSLTSIFGNEITVTDGHRQADREYTGYAGNHGLTCMFLGSRGRDIIVRGTVRGTGASYAAAREDAASKMEEIEQAQWLKEDDYTFRSETYRNVVWNSVEKVPTGNKVYLFSSSGEVIVNFIVYGISLI